MVPAFLFARIPQIYFGQGRLSLLPELCTRYGSRILILTGASSFTSGSDWGNLQDKLLKFNVSWIHKIISSEPSPGMIDQLVTDCISEDIKAVIAIGGGSVIDAGKAVSAMIPLEDSVRNYLEGVGTKTHSGEKIPFIAVPTTAGTGSEATKNAVLSEVGISGYKKSLRHDNFVPDIALVDPLLTLNCPPGITGASGMDAFTQLLESYLSVAANPFTDSLAFEGIKHVKSSLVAAFKNGKDTEARSGMALAALISGVSLANAGLGTVHGFASVIGGYFNIPHGVVCSVLMGPVNRATVRKLQERKEKNLAFSKYVKVGKLFAESENRSDDYYCQCLLETIEKFRQEFQIPGLKSFGISENFINQIAAETDNKHNPVHLNSDELKYCLIQAL